MCIEGVYGELAKLTCSLAKTCKLHSNNGEDTACYYEAQTLLIF